MTCKIWFKDTNKYPEQMQIESYVLDDGFLRLRLPGDEGLAFYNYDSILKFHIF